jgi:hypothetical protein
VTPEANLRDKLAALPPDIELGAAPESLIKRGRQRRAARQSFVVGGAAAAVAAIAASRVALSGNHATKTQTGSGGGLVPAADPACGISPQSTDGAPPAANDGATATPWGEPMSGPSGIAGAQMTVTAFHVGGMPCTNVGFEYALRGADGHLTNLQETNEFAGSDIAPGFHGTGLSTEAGGWFVVGYYVGPAASVTLAVDGQSVDAELTSWSVNPDVKVWWVHGTGAVPTAAQPTARDVAGNPLPGGSHSDQLGVG